MQQHVFLISAICSKAGISFAIICPGSRSAPLLYAFLSEKGITCLSITDERSAAFVALGIARSCKKPVVLICTSGTAALNFFPAIAEAFYQKIPLLVLTADRPPELLNQQDGQMIMQKNVYGKHVLASHELPCIDDEKISAKLTKQIMWEAINTCESYTGMGPVHINVPLNEPLYPSAINSVYDINNNIVSAKKTNPIIHAALLTEITELFNKSAKRLIVVGLANKDNNLSQQLKQLALLPNTIILADVASNQQKDNTICNFDAVLQYANADMLNYLKPDLIISFGGPLVSKSLKNWLKTIQATTHIRIQPNEQPVNTYGNLTHSVQANVVEFLTKLFLKTDKGCAEVNNYTQTWLSLSQKVKNMQQQFIAKYNWFEIAAVNYILQHLPKNTVLHLASSSVIRFASWLGLPNNVSAVYANRGTSGIDGTVSTAIGAAIAEPNRQHILLTGDLSFWYDSNAFWLNFNLPQNLLVIVFNNAGGGIFKWIDGPSEKLEHLHYFTTPHNRSIINLAADFGINYALVKSIDALKKQFKNMLNKRNTAILELNFTDEENIKSIKAFKNLKYEK